MMRMRRTPTMFQDNVSACQKKSGVCIHADLISPKSGALHVGKDVDWDAQRPQVTSWESDRSGKTKNNYWSKWVLSLSLRFWE